MNNICFKYDDITLNENNYKNAILIIEKCQIIKQLGEVFTKIQTIENIRIELDFFNNKFKFKDIKFIGFSRIDGLPMFSIDTNAIRKNKIKKLLDYEC